MMKYRTILFICVVSLVTGITSVTAQENKTLRTNTWSAYAQGGMSWATGLEYKNINNATGMSVSPEAGLGVNYNLRPWVRFGLNWEISKFKREQRFNEFQPVAPSFGNPAEGFTKLESNYGGIAYGKMWTRYNNLDLTAEFNIMEIWPNRKLSKFNLYAGLGAGVMFAKGNTYTIGMGSEYWTDPDNYDPIGNSAVKDNWSSTAWVKANNAHHNFCAFYIPVVLSAEYDLTPRFTLGLKGGYKAVISGHHMAANGIETLAVVVRYNFLGAKHGVRSNKRKYEDAMAAYNALKNDYDALYAQNEANEAEARKAAQDCRKAIDKLNNENEALRQTLNDCQEKCAAEPEVVIIQFGWGMSRISKDDLQRLESLAQNIKADEKIMINLTGEASADGSKRANQRLSEKRLKNVMDALNNMGIDSNRIRSAKAIGDKNRVFNAANRRVEIVIYK